MHVNCVCEQVKRSLEDELTDSKEASERQSRRSELRLKELEDELQVAKAESSRIAHVRRGREGGRGIDMTGCGLLQEDVAKLQRDNAELRQQEQTLTHRLHYLETEQNKQVMDSLQLRSDLDRCRQELSQHKMEKVEISRQVSEKDTEVSRLNRQISEMQERLESEAKTKDKKS